MGMFEDRSDKDLQDLRQELLDRLDDYQDFTPGSLQEDRKCGRQNCHCAQPGDPGHPRYSVMRYQPGGNSKRAVPRGLLDEVKDRIARWNDFQRVCAEIADVNHELSRRLLAGGRPATRPGARAEKRGPPTSGKLPSVLN